MSKPHIRLTQRDLVFGIYRGAKDSANPGLNIWFRGAYIWPRQRRKAVKVHIVTFEQPELPMDQGAECAASQPSFSSGGPSLEER